MLYQLRQLWTILTYVSDRGDALLADWYESSVDEVRAAFDARLEALVQQDRWQMPLAKVLEDGDGIVEIRFKAAGVQHRPLGFYGPQRKQFTITICAEERNSRFVPRDAVSIAQNRRTEVLSDVRHSRIWVVD